MYSVQRQSLILEQLEEKGEVDVVGLAELFSTSRETIRRDLKELEKSGLLQRTHGGAVPSENKFSQSYEYPLFAREIKKYDEKQRICKGAAGLLSDGDTIFLDNSSTTLKFLQYVPKGLSLTVVTNSIQVLLQAGNLNHDKINIVSFGGNLNFNNYSLTGMLSNHYARSFFPDKAIISCHGISEKSGMTDTSFLEAEVKQIMIENSKELLLLADYTKFGLTGAYSIGNLNQVDYLITDSKVDRKNLKMFDGDATNVLVVD